MANDGSWTLEDGEVICRQLGYEIPSEVVMVIINPQCMCRRVTVLGLCVCVCSANSAIAINKTPKMDTI